MAISLRTWSTSDSLSAANLNEDKTTLEAKFAGNINSADLSASAGITNAQLANKHYEIVVNLSVDGVQWAAGAVGEIVAMAGLPADVNTTSYDIVQVDWCMTCFGQATTTTAAAFTLDWGYFGSDTAWTVTEAVKSAQSVGLIAINQGSAGTCASATANIAMETANVNFLGLKVSAAGTDFNHLGQRLTVAVKLKRTEGLRT